MFSKKIWTIFSIMLLISLGACSTLQSNPARAQETVPHQLYVNGNGQVYLVPDVAYITIGVHTQADQVTDALAENTAQAQAVADALKAEGIAEEDIQTTSFNIFPQNEYGQMGEIIGTTYIVDNSVFIKVYDLQNLGALLDIVVRSGANNINNIQFDVQDKTEAINEARRKAIEDARSQALVLADAAGVTLGDLVSLSVSESSSPVPVYNKGMGGMSMTSEMSADVPVSSGQLVLTVQANLAYEIK